MLFTYATQLVTFVGTKPALDKACRVATVVTLRQLLAKLPLD